MILIVSDFCFLRTQSHIVNYGAIVESCEPSDEK
jgi:hypothetical protein